MDENTQFQYGEGFKKQNKFALSIYLAIALILASIGLWYLWSFNKTVMEIREQTIVNTQNINAIATFLNQVQQAQQSQKVENK